MPVSTTSSYCPFEFYQQSPGKLAEAVFTRKDESLVYIETEVRIDIEQGFIDFVIIDISERHAVELALQESIEAKSQAENPLQTMIEHSPIPISVKDLSGKYLYFSHAYNDYLNFNVDEVLGKRSADFLEAGMSDRIRSADEQVVATGMPLEKDQSFAITFGQSTLQVSKFPIFDTNGDVSGIATIGVDVTELMRVRNELQQHRDQLELLVAQRSEEFGESEEVFRSFYEVIPDISMITGLDESRAAHTIERDHRIHPGLANERQPGTDRQAAKSLWNYPQKWRTPAATH